MKRWRFVPYSEHSGATNMAIDELLLEGVLDGTGQPTLRLYGFKPPAVSIGLNQKLDSETTERIENAGLDVVRRPTGGRAVLHLNDLTYAFIGLDESREGILKTSVTAAYRQICQGLVQSLRELGVDSELGETQAPYRHLADCFLATTQADLHHKGRKLAGSAQLRRKGAVLQHGSLPLQQRQDAMAKLLGDSDQTAPQDRHLNLFELTQQRAFCEIDKAWIEGFESVFQVKFETKALTEQELELAHSRRDSYRYSQ
ncbi:MAG: lipoate--protein ligase family protein [Candidatus Obscuribacterales bacterium]|nr:lipoate--protein ligase family protein [Candidatus Obscuribacterales bacterium]